MDLLSYPSADVYTEYVYMDFLLSPVSILISIVQVFSQAFHSRNNSIVFTNTEKWQ